MKKLFFPIFLISAGIGLLVSCQNNNNNKKAGPSATEETTPSGDSVTNENVDSVFSNETIRFFDQSGLSDYARKKAPQFDWSQFALKEVWEDDSLPSKPFRPDRDFFAAYGKLLKYSPDSSRFIDLDSYNIQLEKDKNGHWTRGIEGGPDNETSLVDLNDSTRTRLFFFGPGSSVEDAVWANSNTVYLVGVYENPDSEKQVPVVWKYEVDNNTFYLYESSNQSLADKILHYTRDVRWKGLDIK